MWDEAARGDMEWSDVEYVIQTLIDNDSLRKGLLYHMEKLQPEVQLLSSLEPPAETISKILGKLTELNKKDDPNEALGVAK